MLDRVVDPMGNYYDVFYNGEDADSPIGPHAMHPVTVPDITEEDRSGPTLVALGEGQWAQPVDVLIIGAGLSGIGAACYLKARCPTKSFAILEARHSLGGTWDLFRYPGIRSDSDMFTLGFSFRP